MRNKLWFAERCLVKMLRQERCLADIEDIIHALYMVQAQYKAVDKEVEKHKVSQGDCMEEL